MLLLIFNLHLQSDSFSVSEYGSMFKTILTKITRRVFEGVRVRLSNLKALDEMSSMVVVVSFSGAFALHKVDETMKNFQILPPHLKSQGIGLKPGHIWIFQQDDNPKHTGTLKLFSDWMI